LIAANAVSRIVPVGTLTMLRRGEIIGLRDRDIDFETGSIAAFSQRQDSRQVQTKTRAARRTIDFGPQVLKLPPRAAARTARPC
jgi:integrase